LPTVPANVQLPIDGRSIARIENAVGAGRTFGSGTLVDVSGEQALVVTCAHLFREGTGTIVVTFPGGAGFGGRVAKVDAAADLAAVLIAAPAIEPVEVAVQYPRSGDPLVSCGYGGDGRLWCNRGEALGYVTTLGSHGCETLELSGSARQGDSGGPVLDQQGHLAAVLFGTNGRVVDATYCGRVREFLRGLSPRFAAPARPETPAPNNPPAQPEQARPPILRPIAPRRERNPDANAPVQNPSSQNNPAQTTPAENNSAGNNPLDGAIDAIAGAAQPWLSAKAAALLVSVGLPGGIAGLAGGAIVWLVMRRGKQRAHAEAERLRERIAGAASNSSTATASSESLAARVAAPVTADSAKKEIIERHHNRYVPYEAKTIDKAWAGAHARVSEKYPGAVPYLTIVEGVKDQLLSGIEEPQVS
jgi:hypothetical protein